MKTTIKTTIQSKNQKTPEWKKAISRTLGLVFSLSGIANQFMASCSGITNR